MDTPYPSFQSIPRLFRDCTITEKIDGTNGLIEFVHREEFLSRYPANGCFVGVDDIVMMVGSRNRWLYPAKGMDNAGFAEWAYERASELLKVLGFGKHYGEWWGKGIQRGYGLNEKRFSLFNTTKWNPEVKEAPFKIADFGLYVVPTLYTGLFSTETVGTFLDALVDMGSCATSEPYNNPEGIVVFHHASGQYFKSTIGNDGHKTNGGT